jgi:hypothetical protein
VKSGVIRNPRLASSWSALTPPGHQANALLCVGFAVVVVLHRRFGSGTSSLPETTCENELRMSCGRTGTTFPAVPGIAFALEATTQMSLAGGGRQSSANGITCNPAPSRTRPGRATL